MHLVFDIFTGIGIAAAVGIRPFLPALVVGALAAANVELHFTHTGYSFLQSWPFLLVMAIGAIVLAVAESRLGRERADSTPALVVLGLIGAVLGALLFAGSLARGHYAPGAGLLAGVICAAIAIAATRPMFARVRARLDRGAAAAIPLYAEGFAVLLGALSVLLPPVGLIGLAFLLWLLVGGRRREGQKYAGLRILR
jgi:uncharacterized membrane protein YeaQ/YmgE (transglycosylase-associated protein family)